MSNTFENFKLSKIKDKIDGFIFGEINPWPQTNINPPFSNTRGFLPPDMIPPTQVSNGNGTLSKFSNITDWRGFKINTPNNVIETNDRFKLSINIPKSNDELKESPYSMRDIPLIFNDYRYDYFKHGLQTLNNLNPIENLENGSSLRLSQFTQTPFENNDPVMFGFEIIIDAVSSPLLNGSINDFINNYNTVNEIAARGQVYEDFKQQFIKFFRTKGTVRINDLQVPTMSKMNVNSANQDSQLSIFWPGKKAYLGYYLKKVGGLDLLVESNKGDAMKYFASYKKEFITLDFLEDVSLSVATMAHLYKLLYWSKPNGKNIIPENLLRFNCDIIISECRNFNRTRKAVEEGNLEIIKDNLSRHIYSLRECQFYFDKMPHGNDVDLGGAGPSIYDNYTVQFDFKYVTNKFERFVPVGDFGQYVGYNSGAIWKIGNPGERENRGENSGGSRTDSSVPKFFTVGGNTYNENGVDKPFVNKIEGEKNLRQKVEEVNPEIEEINKRNKGQGLNEIKDKIKNGAITRARNATFNARNQVSGRVQQEKQKLLNNALNQARNFIAQGVSDLRKNLLNKSLSKINNQIPESPISPFFQRDLSQNLSVYGNRGLTDKTKTVAGAPKKPVYDLKGQLINFAGGSLGGGLTGG
jgi:hypothetical protein